jgi:hypothetical protein
MRSPTPLFRFFHPIPLPHHAEKVLPSDLIAEYGPTGERFSHPIMQNAPTMQNAWSPASSRKRSPHPTCVRFSFRTMQKAPHHSGTPPPTYSEAELPCQSCRKAVVMQNVPFPITEKKILLLNAKFRVERSHPFHHAKKVLHRVVFLPPRCRLSAISHL